MVGPGMTNAQRVAAVFSRGSFSDSGLGRPLASISALLVIALAMLVCASSASAVSNKDLTASGANLQIDGAAVGDSSGWDVSGAGDVNNDGKDDLLVSAPFAGAGDNGSAYVVYGTTSQTTIDLNALTVAQGFRIDGAASNDRIGSAAGAGDVNGDGKDDIIVGTWSTRAYVIYGGVPSQGTIDLSVALTGAQGYRIDNLAPNGNHSNVVAGAGDVNGDGKDDVIVGADQTDNTANNSGSSYVIYGTTAQSTVDVMNTTTFPQSLGFRIDGTTTANSNSGYSVDGAGDVNGDGEDDVIVGAVGDAPGGGAAYVVYGETGATQSTISLESLAQADGYKFFGATGNDRVGGSVAGAGDVNGDGKDDVIIGGYGVGAGDDGASYVIYGTASQLSVFTTTSLTSSVGFTLAGAAPGDESGESVDGAGDVNGDGKDDVIIGSSLADNNARNNSGSAYVVYGAGTQADLNLGSLTAPRGFRIDGAASAQAGYAVAGTGDFNGDNIDDVATSTPFASPNTRSTSGSSFVIYGGSDAPTAVNDSKTLTENDPATPIDVLANDTDPDAGPAKTVISKTNGSKGTVTNRGTDVMYTPAGDTCGADSFTYTLNGGSTATVSVTVTCVDDLPTAVNDSKTLNEDAPATSINVLANDTDIDGGPKAITAKTNGTHGTVAITNAGADLTYTPDAGYCGPDSFSYTLNGGSLATVSVTVTCVDDLPTAVNDSKTLNEDAGATTIDVLANDTDTDAGPKTVNSKTNGAHGTVAITNAGADLTYTPAADYCGPDSFTYTLNGGSTATVTITVTCVDESPTAVNDTKTLNEDAPATMIDVLANDTDIDGGTKAVTAKTNGAHGAVTIIGGGAAVAYAPAANYCGADSFTYTVNGGSQATVSVTVTCVQDAPTAANDSKTVAEGSSATAIDVLSNDTDVDGGTKTIASKTNGANGTVVITGSGSGLTYAPNATFCGADSFTYTLNGGSTATVSVTVTCAPPADTTPPNTTITKKPKPKLKKGKAAKFEFNSDEAGSTFECSLTGKGLKDSVTEYSACNSPKSYKKLKPGKYKFHVRATDAAGNVDQTPASAKFKVKK